MATESVAAHKDEILASLYDSMHAASVVPYATPSSQPGVDRDRLRTVCLNGLPREIAVYDIIKQINTGVITHVTPSVMGKGLAVQTVLITFLTAEAATGCINHLQRTSTILSSLSAENLTVEVHPEPMISSPIKSALHDLITTGTVTRILLLRDLDPDIQHAAISENLRNTMHRTGSEHHDILAIEDMPSTDNTNTKRIHFNSVKNAIRAFRVVLSEPFFLGSTVNFGADPCDPDGRTRLEGKVEMPDWVIDGSLSEGYQHRQRVSPPADPAAEWKSEGVAEGFDDLPESAMAFNSGWSNDSPAMLTEDEIGFMARRDSVIMDGEESQGSGATEGIASSGLLIEGLGEVTVPNHVDSGAESQAEASSLLD